MAALIAATASSFSPATAAASASKVPSIASNFTAFLRLLTTQLQNQNPLDPLDTNQFTQQLVQFAQVEQQLKSNDQLAALVALQKTAQSTAALDYVGKTVVVDGATTQLAGNSAMWSFSAPRPAVATISITDATGELAYTGSYTVEAGQQEFLWDGRGVDGRQWPDGAYTMSITAKDANGQAVAISTEVQGIVDSADLQQDPPILTVGGLEFGLDQIKRVVRGTI
ncbi:MAG: flagellar hook capping FlgD N-terminal domain-containing protein [Xanthobacteraceae bacterium]